MRLFLKTEKEQGGMKITQNCNDAWILEDTFTVQAGFCLLYDNLVTFQDAKGHDPQKLHCQIVASEIKPIIRRK